MARYFELKSFYDVDKTIGTGGFAKVKLATHLLTGEKVAIKIMDKRVLGDDDARVKMELKALKSISHHHICKLYQVIETVTHYFIVMEYCSGGELFDHIVEKSKLTEAEARGFFRQIVSAVGYLHKMGYAHRDLKPENILLDKELNLKLIDFGLCAKPLGGMASLLLTSCGSPTYAAPELIKGYKYLGSEVDVWSLGVLLYALLCGFLPFDSENLEKLYNKILSGKYDEPPWLSQSSKCIIRRMLQTDPKQRMTIEELVVHPWLTANYYEPVNCETLHEFREKDEGVLRCMAEYYGTTSDEIWSRIRRWNYDYDTATYMLLLARKKKGLALSLKCNSGPWLRMRQRRVPCPRAPVLVKKPLSEPSDLSPRSRLSYCEMVESINRIGCTSSLENINEKENTGTPESNPRKCRKRMHGTGKDDVVSPVPVKITPGKRRSTVGAIPAVSSPATPISTPGNKLICSIERKLNQVRNVLTPRKRGAAKENLSPVLLSAKDVCNVSTTSSQNPIEVMDVLKNALEEKGIVCKINGFVLRGKAMENVKNNDVQLKLSFELEICLIKSSADSVPVVGIRRKRLKGDAWRYKRVCEQVLSLTNKSDAS